MKEETKNIESVDFSLPVREDITVLPAEDPNKLRLGWVVYESYGGHVFINRPALKKLDKKKNRMQKIKDWKRNNAQ